MTQTEIADRVGISQMHVSRLLRRSLDKLTRATAGTAQCSTAKFPAAE